jgi:hypothetical protein
VLVQTPIYKYLALAGTLPFILCTFVVNSPSSSMEMLEWSIMALHSYGLIIVTFMCGTHWGLYLVTHQQCQWNLLVISNLITLACWFCYLSEHGTLIIASQICAFLALIFIDAQLHQHKILNTDYFKTRGSMTAIVVLTLSINIII